MGKKNSNRKKSHDELPAFPGFASAHDALHWWREKLRDGFPWPGAAEHLESLARENDDMPLREKFQALGRLAGRTLEQAGRLSSLPDALSCFITDPESGKLFIASATGGITCLDQTGGKRLWTIEPERAFQIGGLAVCDDTLYYTDSWRDKLYAVCVQSGQQTWCVDKAGDGSPLLSPAGVVVTHDEKGKHLLVCDSGNHRICSFTTGGAGESTCGQRGLEREQVIHVHSAPDSAVVPPYFEYPKGLAVAHDQNDKETVFVWDSGNGRLVLLTSELAPLHTIPIMPGKQVKPRLAGQVTVLDGASGPVIAVIDDVRRTLSLRGPLGESLLTVDLAALLSSRRKLDCFRLDCRGYSDNGVLLLSSSGAMWRIPPDALDTARLTADLLPLYPEDCRLVLAHAGLGGCDHGRGWREISPVLDHNALVRGLFDNCHILGDQFALTVKSLDELVLALRGQSSENDASALEQTLLSRLDELRAATLKELLHRSRLSPGEIERWSDAHAEVDMELFQTRGRKSSAELTRDEHLEQIRELRPSIRSLGWQLRVLHRLLDPRRDSGWLAGITGGLLDELEANLNSRVRVVATTTAGLQYDRDPQRVARKEIQAAHAAMLCVSALDGAAVELAGEIARIARQHPSLLDPEKLEKTGKILGKAAGLQCREILLRIDGVTPDGPDSENKLPDNELFSDGISEKIRPLVENMVSYLAKVESSGSSGGQFGKVLDRQRNLFALKASLLSNFSQPGEDCLALLEHARTLAGEAWKIHGPLRLTEPQMERVK